MDEGKRLKHGIDERPFTCQVCSKGFKTRPHLIQHGAVHSDQRPFGCDVCGKTFKSQREVRAHTRGFTQLPVFLNVKFVTKSSAHVTHWKVIQLSIPTHDPSDVTLAEPNSKLKVLCASTPSPTLKLENLSVTSVVTSSKLVWSFCPTPAYIRTYSCSTVKCVGNSLKLNRKRKLTHAFIPMSDHLNATPAGLCLKAG